MTIKKAHTVKTMAADEAPMLDENVSRLYQNKLEARQHNDSGTAKILSFQSMETGVFSASATAAAGSIAYTRALEASKGPVTLTQSEVNTVGLFTTVTDVTQTSITVTVHAAADITSTATGVYQVRYAVWTSNP